MNYSSKFEKKWMETLKFVILTAFFLVSVASAGTVYNAMWDKKQYKSGANATGSEKSYVNLSLVAGSLAMLLVQLYFTGYFLKFLREWYTGNIGCNVCTPTDTCSL